jgi:hypothetical protein
MSAPPCGTRSSSTIIVMMIAITPSLNASSRVFVMRGIISESIETNNPAHRISVF